MTVLPKAVRLEAVRLEAVAALARERPVPWDEKRRERIARRLTHGIRSPLADFRRFAWVGVAGVAVLALYLPAADALRRGASEESPVSASPRSEYTAPGSVDSEPARPLGDGGLEACVE